jgi:DNA-binding transcriptional LysR family regulator
LDIRQLEVFYHVARLRSFSKAGRFVGLTQPSVSGSIQSLENILGLKLFNRTGRGVSLTKAGEVLFIYAKRISALRKEALQQIESLAGLKKGILTIGASSIPGEYIVPGMIQAFYKTHPGIFCILKVSDSQKVIQDLLDHDIEIGFVGTCGTQPDIVYESIMEDRMIVCCSARHEWSKRKHVSFNELVDQPFLIREEGSGTRKEIERQLQGAGIGLGDLQIIAEIGSTEAIKQAIKAGYGISILSAISVKDLEESGAVKSLNIGDMPLMRHFYIAELKNREKSPAHKQFKHEILNNKEFINASR